MAFYNPPRRSQGQYRYDPTALSQAGPARIFPHAGEDGLLRYVSTVWGQTLVDQGRLSQPWSLLAEQMEQRFQDLEQVWFYLTTQLVDLKVFQSGWFNGELPPNEQFDANFVQLRRRMIGALRDAQKLAEPAQTIIEGRSLFYASLAHHGQPQPVTLKLHQRDEGLGDREFARQRLAGPNPMVLRRAQATDQPRLQSWAGIPCQLSTGEPVNLTQTAASNSLFSVY